MILYYLLHSVSASPTEKIMHAVHESVGWGVFALVSSVLVIGGLRTYYLNRRTETELAAMIDGNAVLKAICSLHRKYLGPAYRRTFVLGAIGLCSWVYRVFEVGIVDKANYAAATGIRRFSDFLYRYIDSATIDGLNYMVANAARGISNVLLKYVEVSVIDNFNYLVAGSAVALSSRFRKTHTGILSYNMMLAGFAFVGFLVLALYLGGFLK